jgi:hypothetical protein
MLAGAVVAVGLQHPLLIAPIAVLSHFVLDGLPHFGVHRHDHAKRNRHPLFQYMLAVDIALAVAMVLLLPSILSGAVSAWVLLIGMGFAFLPDVTWIYRFFTLPKNRKAENESWISIFHEKIQWGERTWGVFVEIVFFGLMGVVLGILAA